MTGGPFIRFLFFLALGYFWRAVRLAVVVGMAILIMLMILDCFAGMAEIYYKI